MNKTNCLPPRTAAALVVTVFVSSFAAGSSAQDWPQWRGANGAARAADFKAPKTWPKELTQKWKVAVGEGVATPALVGDRLYVFSRQDGSEVIRCLDAASGKELWLDKYDSLGATGPAQGFSGPRSSPAVADGKVVTVGVRGIVSCLDAASGRLLWRRDDFQAWPNFFVASSPLILDGAVVAQLGGRENGALVAYDLATGNEKWRWRSGNPSYASPAVVTVDGSKLVVVQTEARLAAVNAADGSVVWEGDAATPPESPAGRAGRGGGGRDYKATTPAVEGPVVFITGRANKAIRFEKSGEGFRANQLWSNEEKASQFASPVLKEGTLFCLSAANELFALDARNGNLLWSAGITAASQPALAPAEPRGEGGPARPEGPGGRGGPGGGRMGGGGGYGSVVDAGTVLLALTPGAELVAFEPSRDAFKEVARLRVADSPTHAYPVPAGNRIFVKDRDSVILWTVE